MEDCPTPCLDFVVTVSIVIVISIFFSFHFAISNWPIQVSAKQCFSFDW